MTTVINIFGGPGSGKTTLAAGLFHKMKINQVEVELVSEYAKDMVWEERPNIMDDQLYIFTKQYRRIVRLIDKVDFVIVDSPLLMCNAYILPGYFTKLEPLIVEVFNTFNNINFVKARTTVYNSNGRCQTENQALQKDRDILDVLQKYSAPYYDTDGDIDLILEHIDGL